MPHIEPLSDDQATEAAKTLFQPLQSALGMQKYRNRRQTSEI